MTLAGGDPESLTLRQFLDAAYALLLEEYVRQGVPLLEAIKKTEHLRAGGKAETAVPRPSTSAEAQRPPDSSMLAELERWNELARR